MQAYMSAVHGVMDLEVGCTWRNYGDIYYLTEEQEASPQVQQALQRRWIIPVSDMEVKYASMDHRKIVGPRPVKTVRSSQQLPNRADAQMDSLKRDIAKLNVDVQSLANSVNSIVDLLSKGIPVNAPLASGSQTSQNTPTTASISEQTAEELFIPSFKVKDSVALRAETSTVSDGTADRALEELKKMKRKKKDTPADG